MLAHFTDERLCQLAQNGDPRAAEELVRRYEWSVVAIASAFFLPAAEHDDVEQEARVGLLSAIRTFRPDGGASFRTFAYIAIRRQLITVVKAAHRGKNQLFDRAARVVVNDLGEVTAACECIPAWRDNPQEVLELHEELARLRRGAAELSPMERRSLGHILDGRSYADNKQVDNAASRARLKLRRAV